MAQGTRPLPKTYDFQETEQRVYRWWEERGFFRPSNDPHRPGFSPEIEPFVISIPPPNVTGELHLGHAMFVSMEDLMIRHHRMKGVPSLWVPGSDHAGIATQLQVEKALRREGLTREEIGREAFLERAWAWKERYGGIITQQIRRLGASCDWERERFTLDNGLSEAVREAFVRLYEAGYIYRGPRLINWSPGLKTAVSDLEVEYAEEPGKMYTFKYVFSDAEGVGEGEYIPVATTRPETILGDTALAVHPDDDRFRQHVGRTVTVPILGREIPVIADEYVDREFGTGALKITPGHDPNDYEIGMRHDLPILSVLDESARVNELGGPYAEMDRFEAREAIWADMEEKGLTLKVEPYTLKVPRSQRGGEIIEPMVSTQWFVRMEDLAAPALEAVRDGRIAIIPEHFVKVYYNWLENIQDWCISRQLWWGHRIPVWYCDSCGEITVAREDPDRCEHCGSADIRQDPDVLDTWFSSALWPFSTIGWPENTPDYQYFYPTSVMETGHDILFFWVARMIMAGLEFTDQIPFHTVYLHGLIRDEQGRKMSKTLGNVIDPLEVMDEMGTDALRFTLLVGSTPGKDTNLSLSKVEANRNFTNKVWNIGRFVLGELASAPVQAESGPEWTLADRWIQARLAALIRDVNRLFDGYQFGEAGRQIYDFVWTEFADWYVEIAKLQLAEGGDRAYYTAQTLVRTLDTSLRLLHPFTPFVTEALWGHLKAGAAGFEDEMAPAGGWEQALIIARWPEAASEEDWEALVNDVFSTLMEVVRAIRNLRAEHGLPPGQRIPALVASAEYEEALRRQADTIAALARLDESELRIERSVQAKPEGHVGLVAGQVEVYLPLRDLVDPEQERARLEKEFQEAREQIDRLEELLSGPFSSRAPAEVVEKERDRLESYRKIAEKIKGQMDALRGDNR